jgi:hypothetical protein
MPGGGREHGGIEQFIYGYSINDLLRVVAHGAPLVDGIYRTHSRAGWQPCWQIGHSILEWGCGHSLFRELERTPPLHWAFAAFADFLFFVFMVIIFSKRL